MGHYKLEPSAYMEFGETILNRLGVSNSHAKIQMESLLDADKKGIATHGIYRLRYNHKNNKSICKQIHPFTIFLHFFQE